MAHETGDQKADEKTQPRSMADIQSDLDETRQRLADNLQLLKEETSPKALAGKAGVAIKGTFVAEDGSVRVERVAAAAGVVVGLILVRRGLKARAHKRNIKRLAEVVWVPVPRESVNPQIAPYARNAKELAPYTPDLAPKLAIAAS